MLYSEHDSTFSKIIKQLIFWLSLGAMFVLVIFLMRDEIKMPQRPIVINIDIKNKVNICKPEDQNLEKKKL